MRNEPLVTEAAYRLGSRQSKTFLKKLELQQVRFCRPKYRREKLM